MNYLLNRIKYEVPNLFGANSAHICYIIPNICVAWYTMHAL